MKRPPARKEPLQSQQTGDRLSILQQKGETMKIKFCKLCGYYGIWYINRCPRCGLSHRPI